MADLGTPAGVFRARYLALGCIAFICLQDLVFSILLTAIDNGLFNNTKNYMKVMYLFCSK